MRLLLIILCCLFCGNSIAQPPAVLQWQKSYGGSLFDDATDIKILPDGSFVVLANSNSNDGDITGNHGSFPSVSTDVCVLKFNAAGNLLWQRSYGGVADEVGYTIIQTSDGGFVFLGKTASNDGDVSGNHGPSWSTDMWVVKIDANGNIVWQKCFGGSEIDDGTDILEINGGFMIAGFTSSNDGDVSGHHGNNDNPDLWVLKTDLSGNIIWQKCYGGSLIDGMGYYYGCKNLIKQTLDGNFLIVTRTESVDGDVSNPLPASIQDLWVLKITGTGTILWDKCIGGNFADLMGSLIINSDGSIFMAGLTYSTNLPGSMALGNAKADGWALKLDVAGNILWLRAFGGTDDDKINSAAPTPDGGYILSGSTEADDGIVCKKYLFHDLWLVKLDASGNVQWSRTFGGNKEDNGKRMAFTSSGDCLIVSTSYSNDGDLTANKGFSDLWITRFSFTGTYTYAAVSISSGIQTTFCTGKKVQFNAIPVNGGTKPSYQWKLNGVNVATDSNFVVITNIQDNDVVSCVLTSNSPCVDLKVATSNNITIKVFPLSVPDDFLPQDTSMCSFQIFRLRSDKTYQSYLWNDNSTSPSITVTQPGTYWLQVTDDKECVGRDSIIILPRDCRDKFFVPNAFTPNNDGLNDQLMPLFYASIEKCRFMIFDRWGKMIFETTTLNKGWDGTLNGKICSTGTYAWHCDYQLKGSQPTAESGTVMLIR